MYAKSFSAVCVNFVVFAQESALVECILVGQVARLLNRVLLGVKDVAADAASAILLAPENQDVVLRDRACSKPVLDVGFEGAAPHFDQLPEGRLLHVDRVQALDVCHAWLVPAKHVDEPRLDGHCSRQVPVSVEFWLLSPAVVLDAVDFAGLACVVEP